MLTYSQLASLAIRLQLARREEVHLELVLEQELALELVQEMQQARQVAVKRRWLEQLPEPLVALHAIHLQQVLEQQYDQEKAQLSLLLGLLLVSSLQIRPAQVLHSSQPDISGTRRASYHFAFLLPFARSPLLARAVYELVRRAWQIRHPSLLCVQQLWLQPLLLQLLVSLRMQLALLLHGRHGLLPLARVLERNNQ